MTYSNNRADRNRETRSSAALFAFAVAALVVVGVIFYTFSDRLSSASNSAAITTAGQGIAGASGKGNIGRQQGTHAGEGGRAAPRNQ